MSFSPLIYVAVFIAVVTLAQYLAGAFLSSRDRVKSVNRRLGLLDSGVSEDAVRLLLLRKDAAPTWAHPILVRLHERVDQFRRQAGLQLAPMRLLAIAGGVAVALWLVALSLQQGHGGAGLLLNAVVSLIAAAGLALFAVFVWVNQRRNARLKQIEAQLPTALDIINRAIRAGHPVVSAVHLAALETADPLGSELGLVVDETNYGVEFREALVNFARRTGSNDAGFFAVAVAIQSETGGSLVEILGGLAVVIRGRATLGLRVKALASEGKASAWLLSALPVCLIGMQLLTNPKFYTSKFSDPVFWPVAAGILTLYITGWVIVQRIMNFKY